LEMCKQRIKEKRLEEKFVIHGRHPVEKMPDFYRLADACLLTLKCDNFVGMTMPAKLQSYMAAGKPVIGAINGAAQAVIKESQCGLCVNASDDRALSEIMKAFIEQPDQYKECGINGRNYFKKYFTKEIHMNQLEDLLNNLVKEAKNV
ncbi:MAG: glycosyltransferase, partial [Eubacterium sp.]